MVNRAKQLCELQEIDLDIAARREHIQRLESRLGESQPLVETRASLGMAKSRLGELEKQQREEEWQIDDIGSKVAVLEEKLYGGSIKSPKELTTLQTEVERLKKTKGTREETMLNIMEEVEASRASIKEMGKKLRQMEAEWRAEQRQLVGERDALMGELGSLESKRASLAGRIDAEAVVLYETIRETKQGTAIAKVERGMCQGCRLHLPLNDVQRARAGQELVRCSNCGRILHVS